jgi:F-type H+-transporting ATPase subunit a
VIAVDINFNIENVFAIELFGQQIWINQTVVNTWLIMLFLIAVAIVVRIKLRKMEDVPGGFQNAVEAIIEAFENFVKSMAGERLGFIAPWFFMVFVFILTSNFSAVIGLRPPTADWATTFALALVTFLMIHVVGIKFRGGEYFKSLLGPSLVLAPLIFPLNIIGELSRPISLSFRLFGNVLAGLILMTLIYMLMPVVLGFGIPVVLHAYFDIFVGLLQTFIFCALSLSFIGAASVSEE